MNYNKTHNIMTNIMKNLLVLGMLILLFGACNRQEKKAKVEPVVEVEVFDAVEIKNEIVDIIQKMPDTKSIAEMVNNAGASYIIDLTMPDGSDEKMLTAPQLGIGLGMYAFDIQYAHVYNRTDKVNELIDVEKHIVTRLGIEGELSSSAKLAERLQNNINTKDSVDVLVTQAMNDANDQLAKSDRPDIYAYAVIGGNVEGMYIMSQLALMAEDNTELIKILEEQRERINTMFSLFELMSNDKAITPIYEGLKPVFDIFEKNQTFTEEQLKQLAPVIENVRNSLIK